MRAKSAETFSERLARARREGRKDLRPDMTPEEITAVLEKREQPSKEEVVEGFQRMSASEKGEMGDEIARIAATVQALIEQVQAEAKLPAEKQAELDEMLGNLATAADGLTKSAQAAKVCGLHHHLSDCYRRRRLQQRRTPVAPRSLRCSRNRQKRRRRTAKCTSASGGGDPPDAGDPEPGERPRLAALLLAIAVLVCSLAGGTAVKAPAPAAGTTPPITSPAIDQYWDEAGEHWGEIVDYFVDRGFGENAEILMAMDDRFGLNGMAELIDVLRAGDLRRVQRFCDLVTDQERSTTKGDCYNRLIARRGVGGAVVIVIDQPGNPDYVPPLVVRPTPRFSAPRRFRVRERSSRGKAVRRRGSRRTSSRSPDDPDPEPEPALGRNLTAIPDTLRVAGGGYNAAVVTA